MDPDDPILQARVENLRWLLDCRVAPVRAAVQAGWPSARAAERHLQRVGMFDLANVVARDIGWSWAREERALPGEAWKLHDERVSA